MILIAVSTQQIAYNIHLYAHISMYFMLSVITLAKTCINQQASCDILLVSQVHSRVATLYEVAVTLYEVFDTVYEVFGTSYPFSLTVYPLTVTGYPPAVRE